MYNRKSLTPGCRPISLLPVGEGPGMRAYQKATPPGLGNATLNTSL